MIRKIKKHLKITTNRINTSSESKRLLSIDNDLLRTVYKAIERSKKENFTEEEKKDFSNCENYRKELLSSEEVITYEIFGLDKTAIVKDICEKAASSPKWCQLLYTLTKDTNSKSIFEIGTNLGISGTYILHATKNTVESQLHTLEGLKQLCDIASTEFKKITKAENFKVWQGLYDDTFDKALAQAGKIDIAFIDGNHQYEPTLEYFEKITYQTDKKALLIFDDINWSDGMHKAWSEIQKSNKINFTIDLYEIGLALIDKKYKGDKLNFNFHYNY